MQIERLAIPMREALHFLGWRGTPLEDRVILQIREIIDRAENELRPRVQMHRFFMSPNGELTGSTMTPKGEDVNRLLAGCGEAVLLAATLGAQSERMLLKAQAKSSTEAVLLDAVLSAAIEAVCDGQENALREQLAAQGLYLTDRFSPGYGDMPLEQTREICAVLATEKTIGLTVSENGIMIPRKSVTAIMGISPTPTARRPSGCANCAMREACTLRENRPDDKHMAADGAKNRRRG